MVDRRVDKESQARERLVKATERAIADDGGEDKHNRRGTERLLLALEQHHPNGDAYARP